VQKEVKWNKVLDRKAWYSQGLKTLGQGRNRYEFQQSMDLENSQDTLRAGWYEALHH
jgi:hypothetical protein